MAKNSIRDFDATSSNNTDIQSVDISEGCSPAGINNAIRELMADIKDVSAGTVALESPQADSLTVTGDLTVDTSTLKVDSTNNRVGIGTTSPISLLHPYNTATTTYSTSTGDYTTFRVQTRNNSSTNGQVASISMVSSGNNGSNNATVNLNCVQDSASSHAASFTVQTRASSGTVGERMRVTQDGTVLIAQTTDNSSDTGHIFTPEGSAFHIRDGGLPFVINRLTNDGAVAAFRKDGSTDGQINVVSDDIAIGTGTTGLRFGTNSYLPHNMTSNGLRDNAIDIGSGSYRYDDIFATNTTIQTSDQNEKQQIASLTDAEITAAKAISKLFKTFKWNDSVEAKGDNARTHTGHVAQEVQSAMTDAGLDVTKYAFWCSDTWWEHLVDVPAVEAVEAVTGTDTDDDGNEVEIILQEAVEAQDAYTRVDAYYTAEDAPEGATQRTRLGIRYPQLLAFIGAATEQRLTHLETLEARIEALENA